MITLIAMIEMNNGLSDKDGNLLFDLPKDMKHFRATTSGKIVVMGRKTWDSLPKKPLAKRKNYVLSKDVSFNPDGAKVLNSVEEVLELSKNSEVFIIGGGEIYEQFLPHADKLILTHVHVVHPFASTFFPDYDTKEWTPVSMIKHEEDDKHQHSFTFATYSRKNKK